MPRYLYIKDDYRRIKDAEKRERIEPPNLGQYDKVEGWLKLSCVKCHTAFNESVSIRHKKCPFCHTQLF